MDSILNLNHELDKLNKLYNEQIKITNFIADNINEFLLRWMINNPSIKFITWKQYTPSFNDGDPCTFTLGEIYGSFLPYEEVNPEDLSLEEIEYSKENKEKKFLFTSSDSFAPKEFIELSKFLNNLTQVLSKKYGEYGAKVLVTSEEVTVEDYDCGY